MQGHAPAGATQSRASVSTLSAPGPATPPVLLTMQGISKSFAGVPALQSVNWSVQVGEVHAIVGENGAGKSTLMKVLSGVYPHASYEGSIVFDGQWQCLEGIRDSEALGIIIIHQEMALVPTLSVAENLFLGHERARAGVIDVAATHQRAAHWLARVGLQCSPTTLVGELGVGQQQLVEIAKALAKNVRLLILDEPTASLGEADSAALLRLLIELKAQGVTSVLISHKLAEVLQVADRITVLRDGRVVDTLDCRHEAVDEDRLIRGMVGRELAQRYPPRQAQAGRVFFELRDWTVAPAGAAGRLRVTGASLQVREGEIVGIAGLMGSGRTELAMSVFGGSWGRHQRGEVRIDGQAVDVSSVPKAIAHGLAYVTEDRKGCGLVLDDAIVHNISLAQLSAIARWGVVNTLQEQGIAQGFRQSLRIRSAGLQQPVAQLSGGNQQKVVLAKWLLTRPRLLILDEPTRGIDVGAKYEIYSLMNTLTAQGMGMVMISSDMPELLGMCDRIHVMSEGRLVAELDRKEASQERIMRAIVAASAT